MSDVVISIAHTHTWAGLVKMISRNFRKVPTGEALLTLWRMTSRIKTGHQMAPLTRSPPGARAQASTSTATKVLNIKQIYVQLCSIQFPLWTSAIEKMIYEEPKEQLCKSLSLVTRFNGVMLNLESCTEWIVGMMKFCCHWWLADYISYAVSIYYPGSLQSILSCLLCTKMQCKYLHMDVRMWCFWHRLPVCLLATLIHQKGVFWQTF